MDREEIIKGLKIATRKIGGCYDNGGWLDNEEALARKSCEEAIKLLKDGTPQPKMARWMRKTKVEGVYDIAGVKTWGVKCQCEKCDFTTTVIEDFGYYNFCPNCGAKMEGE